MQIRSNEIKMSDCSVGFARGTSRDRCRAVHGRAGGLAGSSFCCWERSSSLSQEPWGGDLSVLELQQQKRAGDCDVVPRLRKMIGLCKTDLVLYPRSEGKLKGSCDNSE
jgi:hypothetical protein